MSLIHSYHASIANHSTASNSLSAIWPVLMMVTITQISSVLVLPALPAMADDLRVADSQMRWMVNIFLLGLGCGQLFFGPYSDVVGRRPALLLGLCIGMAGALLCICSDSYGLLLVGRGLTGLGLSALPVIARSTIRDTHQGHALVRVLGILSIAATFGPAVTPMIGGVMVFFWGWSSTLWGIGLIVSVGLIVLYIVFQETRERTIRPLNLSVVLNRYGQLLKDRYFLTRFGVQTLGYLAFAMQTALAPFLLQRNLQVTAAAFGFYMLIPVIGVLCGGVLVVRCHNYRYRMCFGAVVCLILSGLLLYVLPLTKFGLITAFFFQQISYGLILPLATGSLLQCYKANAGAVVALAGALQFAVGGMMSGVLTQHLILTDDGLGIAFLVIAVVIGGLFISWRFVTDSSVGDVSTSEIQ